MFFSPAINQQCVLVGVYNPESPPRSPFLHWITEFLPFTMPRPPAVHLICLSCEPMRPKPEHTSVRNTGLQVHRECQGHKNVDCWGGEKLLFILSFVFSKGRLLSDDLLDIIVWEKV